MGRVLQQSQDKEDYFLTTREIRDEVTCNGSRVVVFGWWGSKRDEVVREVR
jgi:hypothetical protein